MLPYNDWATRLGALKCKLFGTADFGRWADATRFGEWEERTRIIANMVPVGAKVIDFGAGTRRLQELLDPTCAYVPSDLVDRGPDTIVLDLNKRPLPDFTRFAFDVAVFAGVLEYISNLRSFVRWLGNQVPIVITSYETAKSNGRSRARLSEILKRAGAGWVNTYSEQQLVQLFADAGLPLTEFRDWHTPEGDERIYYFERRRAPLATS